MAKKYSFEGVILRFISNPGFHYVNFPFSVKDEFGFSGSVRVECKIGDKTYKRALISDGQGQHYVILNTEMLRYHKVKLGDKVKLEIRKTDAASQIDIPEEFVEALALEEVALKRYEELTPGKQRQICYWISSAKTVDTRVKRSLDILNRLMNNTFKFGQ